MAETKEIKNTAVTNGVRRMIFGLDLHSWEQGMLWSLGFAALAAIAVVVSTTSMVVLTRAANERTQEEFDRYRLETEGKIADAKRDLGLSQERIAELDRSTEELRAANLALEAQIAPRRLDADQMNAIALALKPFAGKRVRLESYVLDVESAVLGKLIQTCLAGAGLIIDVSGMMSVMAYGRASLGLHISGEGQLVTALASAFSDKGGLIVKPNSKPSHGMASIVAHPTEKVPPSDATIFIGTKPVNVPVIEIKQK